MKPRYWAIVISGLALFSTTPSEARLRIETTLPNGIPIWIDYNHAIPKQQALADGIRYTGEAWARLCTTMKTCDKESNGSLWVYLDLSPPDAAGHRHQLCKISTFSKYGQARFSCSENGQLQLDVAKYHHMQILTTEGASCVVEREHDVAQLIDADSSLEVLEVDVTSSHGDLRVTCSKPGYQQKTTIAAWEEQSRIWDGMPCAATLDLDTGKTELRDKNCKRSGVEKWSGYPEIVRVRLEPETK